MIKAYTVPRPYILTFHATGTSYPLTSVEAQRLLDEYPIHNATINRVVLVGHNTPDPKQRTSIRPATLGGGPAFTIEREARYRVQTARRRYFPTLQEATAYASEYFNRTGNVVGIVRAR